MNLEVGAAPRQLKTTMKATRGQNPIAVALAGGLLAGLLAVQKHL